MNRILAIVALLMIAAYPARAQDTLQPVGGPVVKTPPLSDSDFSSVPLQVHFGNAYPNWAGISFTVNWDPTEVNSVGLVPLPGFVLAGSSIFASSAVYTVLFAGASASG